MALTPLQGREGATDRQAAWVVRGAPRQAVRWAARPRDFGVDLAPIRGAAAEAWSKAERRGFDNLLKQ